MYKIFNYLEFDHFLILKIKLEELENTLLPLFNSIKNGQIPHSNASDFIVNKTKLYLTYCCHLSFYFVLKAERLPIENHPIVKNILQFRNVTLFLINKV